MSWSKHQNMESIKRLIGIAASTVICKWWYHVIRVQFKPKALYHVLFWVNGTLNSAFSYRFKLSIFCLKHMFLTAAVRDAVKITHFAYFRTFYAMMTFHAMMTSSIGNISRVTGHLCGEFTGELPAKRPMTRSFEVFFNLRLNKRLSKQWLGWWFETPSHPLWC